MGFKERTIGGLLLAFLLVTALPHVVYGQEKPSAKTGLFESYELKSTNISAFPQWQRVLNAIERQQGLYQRCAENLANCPDPALGKWQLFLKRLKTQNLPEKDVLKTVHRFSRGWPYREDIRVYQQSDYWASPREFVQSGGDCEDFAIFSYVSLIDLGVPKDRMRIVVVRDNIRDIDHAVLAVYPNPVSGEAPIYILDSLMGGVLAEGAFRHYTPFYSVNHGARWIHIPKKSFSQNNNSSYK